MNPNIKLTLEFQADEAQTLINIINEAVKAKGLDLAESSLFFLKKIRQAYANAVHPIDESVLVGENL